MTDVPDGTVAGDEPGSAVTGFPVERDARAEPGSPAVKGYYGRPVLKEPVWIWAVPAYFYAGGAAGAALVLGAVAQLAGRDELHGLVRSCRRIGALGTAAGGVLLIYDLGRPERFLNMLRVFRPTSAMSVGSWTLAVAGASSAGAAVLPGIAGNAAGLVAGASGLPLAGYTGVLLADTAVPLWQAARKVLPWLFMASAASSAGSILEMANLSGPAHRVVSRFGLAGKAAELGGIFALEKTIPPLVGRPLKEGVAGSLWRAAKVFTGISLAASLLPGRRVRRILSPAAGTAGALALRFAVFHAGKVSARDPEAAL